MDRFYKKKGKLAGRRQLGHRFFKGRIFEEKKKKKKKKKVQKGEKN